MKDYNENDRFVLSSEKEPEREEVVDILKETGAEILLNYLPVGSEEATRFYAQCALDAGLLL
jgi:myo-inositol-1-phosphate synthase